MALYKIYFIYAVEKSGDSYNEEFDNLEVAKAALNSIALYTLKLHDNNLMDDYSNCGFIEEFIDGEWQDVDEELLSHIN